jgi:hypothetical protein
MTARKLVTLLGALLLVGIVLAATVTPALAKKAPGSFGTVTGRLERVGGPPSLSPRGLPGRVVFTLLSTGRAFRFPTTSEGYYRATVPGGTYEVTGFPSIGGECRASHRVRVRVHYVTMSVDVTCNVV